MTRTTRDLRLANSFLCASTLAVNRQRGLVPSCPRTVFDGSPAFGRESPAFLAPLEWGCEDAVMLEGGLSQTPAPILLLARETEA